MSIENAILELAAAIRYAADRNNGNGHAIAAANHLTPREEKPEPAAEEKPDPKADKKKAIADAKAAAEAAAQAKAEPEPQVDEADMLGADDTPLDYKKDVKPVLLQLFKGKGQSALADLLKEFGVPNGDKLTTEQLPKVLARANELLVD